MTHSRVAKQGWGYEGFGHNDRWDIVKAHFLYLFVPQRDSFRVPKELPPEETLLTKLSTKLLTKLLTKLWIE